jgi:hypothetical protein
MTTKREPPKPDQDAPSRDEIEAEVPGAKPTESDLEERRARYERERKGLRPDEETC